MQYLLMLALPLVALGAGVWLFHFRLSRAGMAPMFAYVALLTHLQTILVGYPVAFLRLPAPAASSVVFPLTLLLFYLTYRVRGPADAKRFLAVLVVATVAYSMFEALPRIFDYAPSVPHPTKSSSSIDYHSLVYLAPGQTALVCLVGGLLAVADCILLVAVVEAISQAGPVGGRPKTRLHDYYVRFVPVVFGLVAVCALDTVLFNGIALPVLTGHFELRWGAVGALVAVKCGAVVFLFVALCVMAKHSETFRHFLRAPDRLEIRRIGEMCAYLLLPARAQVRGFDVERNTKLKLHTTRALDDVLEDAAESAHLSTFPTVLISVFNATKSDEQTKPNIVLEGPIAAGLQVSPAIKPELFERSEREIAIVIRQCYNEVVVSYVRALQLRLAALNGEFMVGQSNTSGDLTGKQWLSRALVNRRVVGNRGGGMEVTRKEGGAGDEGDGIASWILRGCIPEAGIAHAEPYEVPVLLKPDGGDPMSLELYYFERAKMGEAFAVGDALEVEVIVRKINTTPEVEEKQRNEREDLQQLWKELTGRGDGCGPIASE